MAELLEPKLGLPIDYEDPQYAFPGDIADVTASVARSPMPAGQRVLVPRGGTLGINLAAGLAPAAAIQGLLQAHSAAGGAGTFDLRQTAGRIEIVAIAAKGQDGKVVNITPVLDTPITVPPQQWTGSELVEFVCQAVSQASGTTVSSGMVPTNLLNQSTFTLEASNEPARSVLLRAFAALQYTQPVPMGIPQLSWQLFYAPDDKYYALNIHIVKVEQPAPFGGTFLQTLDR